jgi:cytoskeleton protein RodZ
MDRGVGKTLREARRRRGADLAEVEARTRIRTRFLQAIEREEWDALPGETYARSFIRTYAGYLGLDGARLAEEHRRQVGAERPGEQLLGADPAQVRGGRPREPRFAPRSLALLVSAALVGVLVVVGLSDGGDGGPAGPLPLNPPRSAGPGPAAVQLPARSKPKPGLSLRLTATAEVWVCLLDAGDEPLVDGQILASGAEAGPFRSGSFTVSLGNGEVSMTVNGQQARIPATPSPIGYAIDGGGEMRELPEGERPTCT